VVQTLHPGVAVGERLYGYWPMASHAVLQPDRLSRSRLQRRRAAPGAPACGLQPGAAGQPRPVLHRRQRVHLQALLRPLFITSWLIDDFFADNDFFGASTLLLSSASSKTAYGTAFQLASGPASRWWG
jgi:hypothetical protein